MAKEKREYDITVFPRDTVTTYPKIGVAVDTILVTYVAAGLPPNTLSILKEEWTPELEKKLIREDIEKRLKAKPETFKV